MNFAPLLSDAQLTALLASRICHDLISPVGAINNALELYDDDESMREEALQLIRGASANASARLQFARLAYGASGTAPFAIASRDVETVACLYMQHEKASLNWHGEALIFSKNQAKLLLNLLMVANASLPRGGVIDVVLNSAEEKKIAFTLECRGQNARLPTGFVELAQGNSQEETIDAHVIQFYYALLLVDMANMRLEFYGSDGDVHLHARSE